MRLLSYNIHKGVGGRDRRYRPERILQVIEEENPDLICLQEVDHNARRSRFDDQPKMVARYFHLEDALFQMNCPHQEGGYGNLILSRWPFSAASPPIPAHEPTQAARGPTGRDRHARRHAPT